RFFRRKVTAATDVTGEVSRAPSTRVALLHLVVLTTFAVTQPVFDRLGERPAFLTDSGVGRPAVLLLTGILSILIPAAVAGLVWGIGRMLPRARVPVHAIAVFVLCAVIALPAAKRIEFLPGGLTIGLALGVAAGGTWSYFAFRRFRTLVSAAAPAIVVFPAVF